VLIVDSANRDSRGSIEGTYVASKRRAVAEAGMRDLHRHLEADASQEEIGAVLDGLAEDPSVDGILLQLPLPPGLDIAALVDRIPASKDVDGLPTTSAGLLARGLRGLRPCMPSGVIRLLEGKVSPWKGPASSSWAAPSSPESRWRNYFCSGMQQ
jgi:methylenetetrahydrofolate dehydrogenase (NADP+)/methenyltetrahydrofolate cyclohydrolase